MKVSVGYDKSAQYKEKINPTLAKKKKTVEKTVAKLVFEDNREMIKHNKYCRYSPIRIEQLKSYPCVFMHEI